MAGAGAVAMEKEEDRRVVNNRGGKKRIKFKKI